MKLERDEAEPAGCRAGWGTGEGASVANKTSGFFSERGQMKFSRCTRQHCSVSPMFQVK